MRKQKGRRKMKRLLSVLLAVCILCGFSSGAFATNEEVNVSSTQQTAEAAAMDLISDTIDFDETTTWTVDTQISEVIPTYDTSGNVNAYIFNLTTNGSETGYVLVEMFTAQPNIKEFGYDGKYYMCNITSEPLVYAGERNFYLEDDNGGYLEAVSGSELNITKAEINSDAQAVKAITDSENLSRKMMRREIIYSKNNVPGLWEGSQWQPYTISYFGSTSNNLCGPTCVINMFDYWSERRAAGTLLYGGVTNTFNIIKTNSNWTASNGVTSPNIYSGVRNYFDRYRSSLSYPAGSDHSVWSAYPTFSSMCTQINNRNALYVCAYVSSGNYWHAYLAVGYQDTDHGQYLRVADGFSSSISNFYKVTSQSVDSYFYYRW